MLGSAFDRLSQALVQAGSRRRVLGLLMGVPLADHLTGASDIVARPRRRARHHGAKPQHRQTKTQRSGGQRHEAHSEACIPTGQTCPARKARGKKGKKLGCSKCCQGSFITEASGKTVCGCQPNGGPCTTATASSCCSGFCNGATCQAAPCSAAMPCPACQTCGATGLCEPLADGSACNDGNACTQTDTCQSGVCVGSNPVVCPLPDQCHNPGTCDPASGTCSAPARPNGAACATGNLCLTGETCQAGVCTGGSPVSCPANACQNPGSCDSSTGCSAPTPKPNRTSCSGTNICCDGACCTGCCSAAGATGGTCGGCLVFASSSAGPGALGGLTGADGMCQDLADAVPLPGTYKAWLSTGNGLDECPANGRFRQSAMPYVLVDNPPTQIADDWTDLTTCVGAPTFACLDHAISLTEIGTTVVGNVVVWTNTDTDGTENPAGSDCTNWTSSDGGQNGSYGQTNANYPSWTTSSAGACDAFAHLYCFQQD